MLDFQRLGVKQLDSADACLHYIATFIARKLRLDASRIKQYWQPSYAVQDRLTFYMEDEVLPTLDKPLVLALDEVDLLLRTDFYSDFFALLRFWYNNAALDALWEMLHLILVISTEPYLLIADVNQSPFNVGSKLYLKDFSLQ